MDKLQMAHEWYMKHAYQTTHEKALTKAWQYADAMQEEADKRNSGVPEAVQQHEKEWQPDWSVAPDGFDWWIATAGRDGVCNGGFFSTVKPEPSPMDHSGASCWITMNGELVETNSFGYIGSWRDSLRKRP